MKKILVTSALPYANGPLHIGHIAGAYLPADIYTRYNRQKGVNVIHIGERMNMELPLRLGRNRNMYLRKRSLTIIMNQLLKILND